MEMSDLKSKLQHYAILAGAAYSPPSIAEEIFNEQGYHTSTFLDAGGAEAYIIENDKDLVIVFRGTEVSEVSDIKADLQFLKVHGIHRGFADYYLELQEMIYDYMKKYDRKNLNLLTCGHSLGGAMAQICAYDFQDTVHNCYTFGSPRVFGNDLVPDLSYTHTRVVNNNDIVPKVPPALLLYSHYGTKAYINCMGEIRKLTSWQRVKDSLRGRKRAFQKGEKFDGLYDHSIDQYISKLEVNDE